MTTPTGQYAVEGMNANSSFGFDVVSTSTQNIVFHSRYGHFVAEAQLENELPYGSQITIYDKEWNLVEQLQFTPNIEGWFNTNFIPGGKVYPDPVGSSNIFVVDDRWLVFPADYTRYWDDTVYAYKHYSLSFGFLDLHNLEGLKYEDTNPYGVTHTYTNMSFIVATLIPDNGTLQIEPTRIDGKQKVIASEYSVSQESNLSPGLRKPSVWVYDVEAMINAGLANLGGGVVVNEEAFFDVFVGDGTEKEIFWGTGGNNYSYTLPEGFGPDAGTVVSTVPVAKITADPDNNQLIVSDGYKSELYEYTNGSWSTPTVIPNSFEGGQLSGSLYLDSLGKAYYDIINFPDSYLEFTNASEFYHPFTFALPDTLPKLGPDDPAPPTGGPEPEPEPEPQPEPEPNPEPGPEPDPVNDNFFIVKREGRLTTTTPWTTVSVVDIYKESDIQAGNEGTLYNHPNGRTGIYAPSYSLISPIWTTLSGLGINSDHTWDQDGVEPIGVLDSFGHDVTISGNRLYITAPDEHLNGKVGAIYIYALSDLSAQPIRITSEYTHPPHVPSPEPEPEPDLPDGVDHWVASSPRYEWSEYDDFDGTTDVTLLIVWNDVSKLQLVYPSFEDIPTSVTGNDGRTYTRGALQNTYGNESKYYGVIREAQ
jgi:hypothetical protein